MNPCEQFLIISSLVITLLAIIANRQEVYAEVKKLCEGIKGEVELFIK